jgi:Zn-dependent membrane protease YugP
LRNAIYPVANLGSNLAMPLFFIGIFLSLPMFMDLGIVFFAGAVFFSVITLPVEFDASKRAMLALNDGGYLNSNELPAARKVLDAAALTYLAATLMAVLQLIRLLVLRNSRDD